MSILFFCTFQFVSNLFGNNSLAILKKFLPHCLRPFVNFFTSSSGHVVSGVDGQGFLTQTFIAAPVS